MRSQAGITLVELIVAIVVVSIAMASVVGVLAVTSRRSADAMVRDQATAIASAYLEEALSRAFPQPAGPSGATTRQDYANTDDYNFTDAGAHDQNGNAIAGLNQYTITISSSMDNSLAPIPQTDVRRVDVTVRDPGGANVVMSGYKVKL